MLGKLSLYQTKHNQRLILQRADQLTVLVELDLVGVVVNVAILRSNAGPSRLTLKVCSKFPLGM